MVKWHKIKDPNSEWKNKRPKFWSICNWFHRFKYWYKDLYFPYEGYFCRKCKTWWEK